MFSSLLEQMESQEGMAGDTPALNELARQRAVEVGGESRTIVRLVAVQANLVRQALHVVGTGPDSTLYWRRWRQQTWQTVSIPTWRMLTVVAGQNDSDPSAMLLSSEADVFSGKANSGDQPSYSGVPLLKQPNDYRPLLGLELPVVQVGLADLALRKGLRAQIEEICASAGPAEPGSISG